VYVLTTQKDKKLSLVQIFDMPMPINASDGAVCIDYYISKKQIFYLVFGFFDGQSFFKIFCHLNFLKERSECMNFQSIQKIKPMKSNQSFSQSLKLLKKKRHYNYQLQEFI